MKTELIDNNICVIRFVTERGKVIISEEAKK